MFKSLTRVDLLDALCLAAPVALFYDSIGRVLIWSLFLVAFIALRFQCIDRRLLSSLALYLGALALISLLSLHPLLSLSAVFRIFLGFLIFIPGVFVGSRWRVAPPRPISFLPVLILAAAHFSSPQIFGGHLFFGFEENPNIVGRGLTVSILVLLAAGCSLFDGRSAELQLPRKSSRGILYGLTISTFFVLLVLSNFRSGWLGLFVAASYLLFTGQSLSRARKILVGLIFLLALVVLVLVKDFKGFGYGSIGERMDLWSRALSSWHEGFFLFGSGFSSFFKMSHLYVYGDIVRAYHYPHNIIVETLFSVGIVGFAVTMIFFLWLVRIYRASNIEFGSNLARAACAAVLAMGVIGQFDMEYATFHYVASIAFFCGVLYAQRVDLPPAGVMRSLGSA